MRLTRRPRELLTVVVRRLFLSAYRNRVSIAKTITHQTLLLERTIRDEGRRGKTR